MLVLPEPRHTGAGRAAAGGDGGRGEPGRRGGPRRGRGLGRDRRSRTRIVAGAGRRRWLRRRDRAGCSSTRGLWALHLLALQRALPGTAFGLATEVTRELRIVKGAGRGRAAAGRGARRGPRRRPDRRRPPRRPDRGGRQPRDRASGWSPEGHEVAAFAIVASGPNSASPHHDGERPRDPGRRARSSSTSAARSMATARTSTRTLWVTGGDAANGPTGEFRTVHRARPRGQRGGDGRGPARVPPARHLDEVARRRHPRRRLWRRVHPPARPRHRPRRPRGSLPRGWQRRARCGPGWPSASSRASTSQGRFGVRIEDIVVCGETGRTS